MRAMKLTQNFKYIVVPLGLIYVAVLGVSIGGRWDLYEQIAMADRWPSEYGYSFGLVDLFKPSSPYFPGVSLILVALKSLGLLYEPLLYLISSAIVASFFSATYQIYKRFSGKFSYLQYLSTTYVLAILFLPSYLGYAAEWKPDTLGLLFFVSAFILITDKNSNLLKLILAGIMVILAIVTKQQILGLVLGLGISIAFLRRSSLRSINSLAVLGTALALSALIIAIVPGALHFAGWAHMGRSISPTFDRGHIWIFFGLVLVALSLVNRRLTPHKLYENFKKLMPSNKLYIVLSLIWLMIGIAGNLNEGGNSGNLAAGILLLLPILVVSFENSARELNSSLTIFAILMASFSIENSEFMTRLEERNRVADIISEQVRQISVTSPRILISGDSYWAIRELDKISISEIDTWAHLNLGQMYDPRVANTDQLLMSTSPNAVLCVQGCNYQVGMAQSLKSKGFVPIVFDHKSGDGILYFSKETLH